MLRIVPVYLGLYGYA